jgi:hypothetical protein
MMSGGRCRVPNPWDACLRLYVRTHNEALSVVAICVSNPDRSPLQIEG